MKNLNKFLSESNKIEQVYDKDSLQQATYAWEYLIEQKKLTTGIILKIHKILMLNQPLMPDQKGYFRKVPIWIGGREGIHYSLIRLAIESWIKDAKTSIKIPGKNGKHIKLDHIEYERIHPFIDGNGRTGRLFLNWQRVKADLPLLVIKADWPKSDGEQAEYYKWFQ